MRLPRLSPPTPTKASQPGPLPANPAPMKLQLCPPQLHKPRTRKLGTHVSTSLTRSTDSTPTGKRNTHGQRVGSSVFLSRSEATERFSFLNAHECWSVLPLPTGRQWPALSFRKLFCGLLPVTHHHSPPPLLHPSQCLSRLLSAPSMSHAPRDGSSQPVADWLEAPHTCFSCKLTPSYLPPPPLQQGQDL